MFFSECCVISCPLLLFCYPVLSSSPPFFSFFWSALIFIPFLDSAANPLSFRTFFVETGVINALCSLVRPLFVCARYFSLPFSVEMETAASLSIYPSNRTCPRLSFVRTCFLFFSFVVDLAQGRPFPVAGQRELHAREGDHRGGRGGAGPGCRPRRSKRCLPLFFFSLLSLFSPERC